MASTRIPVRRRPLRFGVFAGLVPVVVQLVVLLPLAHCASLDGLAVGAGDASSTPSANGDGSSGDGARSSDAPGPMLEPGEIACASTMTVCDIRMAQCCITVSGTSSMAARTYTTSSAQCAPVNGPNCGQFIGAGNDFTMKFPQQCGTAADCAAGESCCVLPLDAMNRFGKEVSSMKCVAAGSCAMTGRAICTGPSDCQASENCLAETDPVLSHLYGKFCQ